MDRIEKQEYIIGSISLLSNKLTQFGDSIFPDITFKQWFLLVMISKMEMKDKNINAIASFAGTTRQNVKKMLEPLKAKGYVSIEKSVQDTRSLKIELTQKAYKYFNDNTITATEEENRLFTPFSDDELTDLSSKLSKLLDCFAAYEKGKIK